MAGRKAITCSVTIAQPPEQVFAYVTDVSKHAEWSPKPFRVEDQAGMLRRSLSSTQARDSAARSSDLSEPVDLAVAGRR